MTDPIADLLARIQNAFRARHSEVRVPHSKIKKSIADLLLQKEYVTGVTLDESGAFPVIVIGLKYVGKVPAISGIRRLSKPGRRLYTSSKKIPRALGGYGVTIVTTSKGIMSDDVARKQNIGGELLCQIW